MNGFAKRMAALALALVLCVCAVPVQAAPDHVANWGTRGQVATELSEAAQNFYTGENTYDDFLAIEGTAALADVPKSELYIALHTFMYENHTHLTDYGETRTDYQYTDCQEGKYTEPLYCFYSNAGIGPDWDQGKTWNREHTWPQSKGAKKDQPIGGDIIALRPTSSSINSSRGNKAYGESAGFYDPDQDLPQGMSIRGDVARTVLYTYVRWGINLTEKGDGTYAVVNNTTVQGNLWGTSGVIEGLEILLEWMEEDPVDTWELGRNDAVQSITGTRNVFVDYPELAFVLFGQEIPADMVTPSGEAKNQSQTPEPTEPGATQPEPTEPAGAEEEEPETPLWMIVVAAVAVLLIPALSRKKGKKRRRK